MSQGPLAGKRIVEFGAIGPAPYCGMLLADLGADVVRVEAPAASAIKQSVPLLDTRFDVANRGKRAVRLDLKTADGRIGAEALVTRADALVEGFRPGVLERLGLGPSRCKTLNRRLVYGRVTGWGQTGPLAPRAGHDIDYIALSGALHSFGVDGGPPAIPLNVLGDCAGGGLMLAFGLVSAMLEALRSGEGQVVDAAMFEGAAALMAPAYGFRAGGLLGDHRGRNALDGAAPFYAVYRCADGEWIAVGAIEPSFYDEFVRLSGIDDAAVGQPIHQPGWPEAKARWAALFSTRTRAEWEQIFEGSDACVAPVLSTDEAPRHPHAIERGTFVSLEGVTQPAPVPRFERTPGAVRWAAPARSGDLNEIVDAWSAPRD